MAQPDPGTGIPQRTMLETEPTINFTIPEWCVSLNSKTYLTDSQDQFGARAVFNLYMTQEEMSSLIILNGSTGNTSIDDNSGDGSHIFAPDIPSAVPPILSATAKLETALRRQSIGAETVDFEDLSLANSFVCVKSDTVQDELFPGIGRNLIEEYLLSTTKCLFNNTEAFIVTALESRYAVAKELNTLGNAALQYIATQFTPTVATKIVDAISSVRLIEDSKHLFIAGDVLSFTVLLNPPPIQSRIIAGAVVNPRTCVFSIVCSETTTNKCTRYSSTLSSQYLLPTYATNVVSVATGAPTGSYVDTQGCNGYDLTTGTATAFGTKFGVDSYNPNSSLVT